MSYKVLVLIKPTEEQPALVRAAEFARFMPDLEVVLLRVIRDVAPDQEQTVRESTERELNTLMQRYPSITHHKNHIVFAKDVAEAFCQYAEDKAEHFDMAIISANKRNTLKDLFVAPIDSQVMRKIPLPLLVVKDPNAPQRLGRAIVLAIDFEDSSHEKFIDEVLISAATVFAEHFNGEVHVLNCVPPIHRGLMSGNTKSSIILGNSRPLQRSDVHAAELYDFADKHNLPKDRCHIAEGRVDEMIPKVCAKLDARMVCMGTSSKDGVLSAIDQSASELVLEQIKGDIFIVNRYVKFDTAK